MLYSKKDIIFNLNFILLTIIAFVVYGIIGLVILRSPNFRVKALARILRKRAAE